MVAQHYRWDFIGLSTDQKPTPATSEKVVDGSTFYCSDNSKLYVFCKDTWYEKTATGGGGTTYTAGDGIAIADDTISVDPTYVATMAELDARINKGAGAPTTATEGVVGGLYEDTTNGKLYICTTVTAGTDPDPDTYTWEEVGAGGGGVTVVQTTGTSTTDVMSQNAVTGMVFADAGTNTKVRIGTNQDVGQNGVLIGVGAYGNNSGSNEVVIGHSAHSVSDYDGIAIGNLASITPHSAIALGRSATVNANCQGGIALGAYSRATRAGELNIGTSWNATGFNNTAYRVIGGVHDGQTAHDAATVAQGNTLSTSAPTTDTEGVLGQLWTDTTNMHTYQCTAISGSTYTWTQRW